MAQYADMLATRSDFPGFGAMKMMLGEMGEGNTLVARNPLVVASPRANHRHPDGFPFSARPASSSHWVHYPA